MCCGLSSSAAFARLRDAALVTGVLGGVLSYLPIADRLRAGGVSKQWRVAMMQPLLWRDQGWHLRNHVDEANALPLPSWLRERLSVVRCSIDWLLCAAPFAQFRQLKNVRHLDLLTASKIDMAATDAAALCGHLCSLPLESLQLPLLSHEDPSEDDSDSDSVESLQHERAQHLLSVLTRSELDDLAPSPMASWSAHLTHLRRELYLLPNDPMLTALAAQPWPLLRKLQLTWACDESKHFMAFLQQLRRALLPSSTPALTWLEMRVSCFGKDEDDHCVCDAWCMHLFPSVSTLTNLKLDFEGRAQGFALLDVLRLISADAMPQLTWLYLNCFDLEPPSDDELPAAIALLQRMPLTQLDYINPYGGSFKWLHHLPHLSVCALVEECCAESVAAAPNLTDLTCCLPGNDIASIAEEWWRRCGCPPLQHAGLVDEQEWQQHLAERDDRQSTALLAGQVSPVIRVLRGGLDRFKTGEFHLFASSFPYLSHLPQLRELECCLCANDVRVLGLLHRLERLRLGLYEEDAHWSDELMRTLGELPLHRLRSLCLEGDDDRGRWYFEGDPRKPDCPCQNDTEEGAAAFTVAIALKVNAHEVLCTGESACFVCAAGYSGVVKTGAADGDADGAVVVKCPLTLCGLIQLLNLRALTSLKVPWIAACEVEALRILVEKAGRPPLHIERIVPLSRRALLQRHWIDVATLDDDDDD
jgi:hypothetical protein